MCEPAHTRYFLWTVETKTWIRGSSPRKATLTRFLGVSYKLALQGYFPRTALRGAGKGLGEQFLQSLGNLLGRALVGETGGEAPLRVHHIDDRTVVHRVIAPGLRVLGIIHPIGLCRLGDLLRCPGQRQ